MILTIITHLLAFILGAGGVAMYLHKHTAQAVAATTSLAADVAKAKAELLALKAKLP